MQTAQLLLVATFGLATLTSSGATRYVSLVSPNPTPPYTNWVAAASPAQGSVQLGARSATSYQSEIGL